jgi:uncharacterized protein YdhG (YjbR/CyaY superfamily)
VGARSVRDAPAESRPDRRSHRARARPPENGPFIPEQKVAEISAGRAGPRTATLVSSGEVAKSISASPRCETRLMAPSEIDRYLAGLDEPQRSTLEALRKSIMEVVPGAEQCISYGMPAFKVHGKTVAGFAAFKNHLSYLPHSGSVLATVTDDVASYETSKGSLKFAINNPLPKRLVKKLIHTRMEELGLA